MLRRLVVLLAVVSMSACFPFPFPDPDGTGSGGGSTGGGGGSSTGGGAGGGSSSSVPVTVNPTTSTTAIPTTQQCSGTTYGDSGDKPAINTPVSITGVSVTALTLRYDMDIYFGEPTRRATISWEGTGSLSSVQWLAEVHDTQGRQYVNSSGQRVFASYNLGTIRGPGQGFGTDTTGSPSWSETFVTYSNTGGVMNGVTEADARNIYRGCFRLANVRVLRLNGEPARTP